MSSICLRAFRKFFNGKDYGNTKEWGRKEEDFINGLINLLPQTQYYLRTMDTYYDLILLLLKINKAITQYMLSKHIIGRLMCCLLRTQTEFEEPKDITDNLTTVSCSLEIQYRDDIIMDPKRDSLKNFVNPRVSNLSKFYNLLWEFLRYAYHPRREGHTKFLYHKQTMEYKLTLAECRMLNFDVAKIEYMFNSIEPDDKKTLKKICKIIAFSAFGSDEVSNAVRLYIEKLVYDVETNKSQEIYFQLVRIIIKVNDNQQVLRVSVIIKNFTYAPNIDEENA